MDLFEMHKRFSTQRKAEAYLKRMRWPHGVECPVCGKKHPYWISTVRLWSCRECGHRFSITSRTIFHGSRTPLWKWFAAIWFICNSKKGISAKQLERTLGVTYKTAWRMAMQIRTTMKPGHGFEDRLCGIVEVDDAYIGGRRSGGKRGRGAPGKDIVVGMKEREGSMAAIVVPDLTAETLSEVLGMWVERDTELLITDELRSYRKAAQGYRHETICHSQTFVNGNVHTMGVESFWSLFKRAIIGTYHRVSSKYLQAYLNEFAFRYNHRHDPDIFDAVLGRCAD